VKLLRARSLIVVLLLAAGCTSSVGRPTPVYERQIFLLAGQSNMAGRGVVEDQDRVVNPNVEMLTRALTWAPAVDPVHFDKPIAGVGPGRAFGIAVSEHECNAHVGLVPAAVGGSPISSWQPGAVDAATGTHPYDDAITRARAAMRDGKLKAILWHQGEADATPALSVVYADGLRALIARFRSDLGDPSLPFIIGELGIFERAPWSAAKARVDSAQRAVTSTTPNVAFVYSTGLVDKGDTLHFDARSARTLGRRFASAYLLLTHPPQPGSAMPGAGGLRLCSARDMSLSASIQPSACQSPSPGSSRSSSSGWLNAGGSRSCSCS
jgi:hypothetical protein